MNPDRQAGFGGVRAVVSRLVLTGWPAVTMDP